MPNVLPDSRLKDPKGCVMVDWRFPDLLTGRMRRVRLELEPIYCINTCGRRCGYVPRLPTMSNVTWMCYPCSEKWGNEANLWWSSDRQFWDKVACEMLATYGHVLSQTELETLAVQGRLSEGLKLLERESPYRRGLP